MLSSEITGSPNRSLAKSLDPEAFERARRESKHRQRSRQDLRAREGAEGDNIEKGLEGTGKESSSRQNQRERSRSDVGTQIDKDEDGRSRSGLERKHSRRKHSTRQLKGDESPNIEDSKSDVILKRFTRNMDLMHRNSEPNLKRFVEDSKQSSKTEDRAKQTKKVHPAIAIIKAAISAGLKKGTTDTSEKQRIRETSDRLRRHTIAEAAELFNYEPRKFTPTPTSTPSPAPVPRVKRSSTVPNLESARSASPNMDAAHAAKSYTPDLMRYADVDLPKQLTMIAN